MAAAAEGDGHAGEDGGAAGAQRHRPASVVLALEHAGTSASGVARNVDQRLELLAGQAVLGGLGGARPGPDQAGADLRLEGGAGR